MLIALPNWKENMMAIDNFDIERGQADFIVHVHEPEHKRESWEGELPIVFNFTSELMPEGICRKCGHSEKEHLLAISAWRPCYDFPCSDFQLAKPLTEPADSTPKDTSLYDLYVDWEEKHPDQYSYGYFKAGFEAGQTEYAKTRFKLDKLERHFINGVFEAFSRGKEAGQKECAKTHFRPDWKPGAEELVYASREGYAAGLAQGQKEGRKEVVDFIKAGWVEKDEDQSLPENPYALPMTVADANAAKGYCEAQNKMRENGWVKEKK